MARQRELEFLDTNQFVGLLSLLEIESGERGELQG